MGIYEAEWFVGYRNSFLPSKVAIWTPLDYIPQSIPQCNKFITMSPIPGIDGIIIGHGISRSLRRIPRQSAIRSIGSVGSWKGTFSESDIIVLNANNYVPRKQLRLTLETIRRVPNCKLWLHTNIGDPGFQALLEEYEDLSDRLILSMNNQSDEFLSHIYSICQYGLQTSSGEGWSLTNCEHAYLGGRQVVPNFLACGQHFHQVGWTYPVTQVKQKNEGGSTVTVGIAKVSDIVDSLTKALAEDQDTVRRGVAKMQTYLEKHNWKNISKLLKETLEL
jgi:hypothetical protein